MGNSVQHPVLEKVPKNKKEKVDVYVGSNALRVRFFKDMDPLISIGHIDQRTATSKIANSSLTPAVDYSSTRSHNVTQY